MNLIGLSRGSSLLFVWEIILLSTYFKEMLLHFLLIMLKKEAQFTRGPNLMCSKFVTDKLNYNRLDCLLMFVWEIILLSTYFTEILLHFLLIMLKKEVQFTRGPNLMCSKFVTDKLNYYRLDYLHVFVWEIILLSTYFKEMYFIFF